MIIDESHDLNTFSTFKKFMEFLATEPTPHAICQHIVLTWPIHPIAVFAGIRLVSSDASLSLMGYFGAPQEQVQPYLITSLWENSPSSRAIRERSPLTLASRSAIEQSDPEGSKKFPDLRSLIAVPLLTSFSAVGTLEVAFAEDLVHADNAAEFLALCGHALTLYSTGWVNRNGSVNSNGHSNGNSHPVLQAHSPIPKDHATNNHEPRQLSQRQLSILHLMSLKFTNRSIAMRLGFSESTIRQEAMTIYAHLNVQTRKQAVEQAILRGLITEPIDD